MENSVQTSSPLRAPRLELHLSPTSRASALTRTSKDGAGLLAVRKSEERFKSDLRDKEGEIATLRSSVLAGSANRQGLLDKRRFEAVEKVWHDVNDLARLKELSSRIAMLNIKAVAKEASDPKMQSFLSTIGAGTPDLADFKNAARDEQPFLPELAWAYFTAYKTILHANFALYRVLKIGLDDVDKYLSKEQVSKILKAVLPHRSQFIDDREMGHTIICWTRLRAVY